MAKKRFKSRIKVSFSGLIEMFRLFLLGAFKAFPLIFTFGFCFFVFWGVRSALYADPALTVRSLRVEPAGSLMDKERQAIEAKVFGKSMLQVDLSKAAAQLEKESGIYRVRIQKVMPDTLALDIERRRPFTFVQTSPGGMFAVVSQDGIVLDLSQEKSDQLISVEAFESIPGSFKKGNHVNLKGYKECVDFLYAYWQHPFSKQEKIEKIILGPVGQLTLVLKNGPAIFLGKSASAKIGVLPKISPLLKSKDRNQIDYIDLEYTDIIVKRKKI